VELLDGEDAEFDVLLVRGIDKHPVGNLGGALKVANDRLQVVEGFGILCVAGLS
jgi:hypothetical protein